VCSVWALTYALAMATGRTPRVLIVEDEAVILRLLEVNFRLAGFEVETANRGEEALAKATADPPDVAILDIMLPGLSGIEVCERLREAPETAEIPVIMLSARTQDEERERSYALGVVAYVTKPFEPAELVEVVRRALDTLSGA
jgi:two-component system, OmpR family, phosphate regulon response regulator PhoB